MGLRLSITLLALAALTTAVQAQDKTSDKTSDIIARGEYLARAGDCTACHTASEGRLFAGGRPMPTPFGTIYTSNITPDPETGIGKWSAEFFAKKFYDYKAYAENGCPKLPGPEAFTLMPWLDFSRIAPDDLGVIYTYLRSVAPVHNAVETHPSNTAKPAAP